MTLMAESEEELKSFLMKVKEERGRIPMSDSCLFMVEPSLVEKTILSPFNCLDILVENKLTIYAKIYF